jgi:hypothetical protein
MKQLKLEFYVSQNLNESNLSGLFEALIYLRILSIIVGKTSICCFLMIVCQKIRIKSSPKSFLLPKWTDKPGVNC